MKILFLVDRAVGGSGPHRNVVGSLNALVARDDIQVRLLCSRIDTNEPYARSKTIEIDTHFSPHEGGSLFSNIARVISASRGCDLIYVPTGLKSHLYAQFGRAGKPLVVGPNVTPLPLFCRGDSPGRFQLRALCSRWIEASESRRDFVVRASGCAEVQVVHHGIDLQKWTPGKRDLSIWARFGVPGEGMKVLYVGRDNEPRKGVSQLIEAFELARSRASLHELQLVIAGKMSDATMQKLNRIGSVYPLGFISGEMLPQIYASSEIAVVPSSWENFPFTVLEGLASGLPVIAGRTGGIPEQISDGESGILVDLTDDGSTHRRDAAARLADSIQLLATDAGLRGRLGAGARERALKHFSERRLGEDLVRLFQDACSGRSAMAAVGTSSA